MEFLKEFFEKLSFEKKSADGKKHAKVMLMSRGTGRLGYIGPCNSG